MNRRTFSKSLFVLSAASQVSFTKSFAKRFDTLQRGDVVGLICPSGPISNLRLEAAKNNMIQLGLKPLVGKYVLQKKGYLAGTDAQRLDDLHAMYTNPEVKAIWCIRGGYGATRLLHALDFSLIRRNPKPLIGYSDITALHQAIFSKTGLPGIHGPNASSKFDDYVYRSFESLLLGKPFNFQNHQNHALETWKGGKATGKLIGGNLTVFTALCGTPYAPNCRNKIVFLEDIGESPYRIDRMLTQLLDAAHLRRAKGIILGQFTDCETDNPESSLTLQACLESRLLDLDMPILSGFSAGHIDEHLFVPIGGEVSLDASKQKVHFSDRIFS